MRPASRKCFRLWGPLGKVRVLAALADRGDKGAMPVLVNAAKDNAKPVRVAGLLGLGKIGDGSVVQLLAATAAKGAAGAGCRMRSRFRRIPR